MTSHSGEEPGLPLLPSCSDFYGGFTRLAKMDLLNRGFHSEVEQEILGKAEPKPKLTLDTLDQNGTPVQCTIDNTLKWVIQIPGRMSRTFVAFPTFREYQCNTNGEYVTTEQLLPMMTDAIAHKRCPTCHKELVKRRNGFYGCSTYTTTKTYDTCITKISTPDLILKKNYYSVIRQCFSETPDYSFDELEEATKACVSVSMTGFDRVWNMFRDIASTANWKTRVHRRKNFTQWLKLMNDEQRTLFPSEQLNLFETKRLQNATTRKRKREESPKEHLDVNDVKVDVDVDVKVDDVLNIFDVVDNLCGRY